MRKRFLFMLKLATIALIMCIQVFETNAAWGNYDPTFGFSGIAIDNTANNYAPFNVAVQPDGKILVTGGRVYGNYTVVRFMLRRYNSDGSIDTTFGTNGSAIGPETYGFNSNYFGYAIAIYNDKIAVAGRANGVYAVWQFNSDGSRDTSFGNDGLSVLTNYPVLGGRDAELDVQSRKLVLTIPKTMTPYYRLALVRLNISGAIDTAFGTAGESLTELNGYYGTVIGTDGKITIAGRKHDDYSLKGIERRTSNGQPDPFFSPPLTPSSAYGSSGLVKMSNGKYALRDAYPSGSATVILAIDKFSSTGFYQSSFTTFNGSPDGDCPNIFASQSDGKLVTQIQGMMFRTDNELTPSSLETVTCSNLSNIDSVGKAALQSDDKIVAVGTHNDNLVLIRLLAN